MATQDEVSEASQGHVGGRNLPVAIASGVLLAGAFLGSLFWHPAAFTAVVCTLLVIALFESSSVLAEIDVPMLAIPATIGALTTTIGAYHDGPNGQVVGMATLFLVTVGWMLVSRDRREVVRTLTMTLFFGVWVGLLASYAILLATRGVEPRVATLGIIGGAVVGDIGGFAFGVAFGRHKVAPSVSPNKTWEGLIGGIAVAAVLGALVLPAVGDLFDTGTGAAIGAFSAFGGFVGDLVESMLKRDLGVKDLGRIIPGHGGVLDRVDGILVALPLGYYVLELLT